MGKVANIINAYKIAKDVLLGNVVLSTNMSENDWKSYKAQNKTSSILRQSGTQFQSSCYDNCPPLQSVINKKAQAVTKGKIISVDKEDKIIKSVAFDNAMKVLNNPNKYQTRNQLIRTIETFMQVYGAAYVFKIESVGFGLTGLIVIPNNCLTITYNKPSDILSNNQNLVQSYSINLFGRTYLLQGDNVNLIYEIQDVSINVTNGKEYTPKSRVDVLRKPIENIIGSLESRNVIIKKRGSEGILSPQRGDGAGIAIALTPKAKQELQDDYAKYGLLDDQWHTLITNTPMQYQKIGMNVKEMGLFDGENADHRAIAHAYGVPIPLLGLPETGKYSTYQEAKREFYEDSIITDAEIISQAFDAIFESYKYGYKFYFDFSYLECMQLSQKQKAETFEIMVNSVNAALETGLMTIEDSKLLIKDFAK